MEIQKLWASMILCIPYSTKAHTLQHELSQIQKSTSNRNALLHHPLPLTRLSFLHPLQHCHRFLLTSRSGALSATDQEATRLHELPSIFDSGHNTDFALSTGDGHVHLFIVLVRKVLHNHREQHHGSPCPSHQPRTPHCHGTS